MAGGTVLTLGGRVAGGHVEIVDGRVAGVGAGAGAPAPGDEVIDAEGLFVAPGFVDTHIHGIGGFDAMAGEAGVRGMARELAKHGVTAFLPTLASAPPPELAGLVAEIASLKTAGARMAGLHLEGPFLDPRAPGMFAPEDFRPFDVDELEALVKAGDGALQLMTLACQGARADALARIIMAGIVPSLGHAAGTYAEAKRAIEHGLARCTHCFNAMTGMHHREPGIAGAMLEHDAVTAELILDGIHVHPAMARLLFERKGAEGVALVSDAMPFAGRGEGAFDWRGYQITVAGGAARIPTGNLAGSVLMLDGAVRNAVEYLDVPPELAVEMASLTPARSAGLEDEHGKLEPGRRADVVLLDAELQPVRTLVGGTTVWAAGT
ncbi:MAG: N-acetylglucosamine-6-phosphate deacetylase [Chloroflexota bacterium]|jgi:N-acetylglucosamine-6-phosphate deacetylase|nr:N-acetylglucosamine-6-phosphate deacetylase [Chloroflexota bacterium]